MPITAQETATINTSGTVSDKVKLPETSTIAPKSAAQPTVQPTATKEPAPPADTLLLELNLTIPGSNISPYIYGLADTDNKDPRYADNLKPKLLRWGGNPSTRFNWVLGNAWNSGRDYEFRNGNYGFVNRDVATENVQKAIKNNMAMLLTIPTIGWVAKNSDTNTQSVNVPAKGGPPIRAGSEEIKGYNPADNRALTSVRSEPRKNGPFVLQPDPASPVIYQDEWVASLVKRFGPASGGGVKFYAMDNEPELWYVIHTDVRPAQWSYDELVSRYTDYATAVKDVDPSAEITGPVSWGWTGYFYSPLDQGDDTFKSAPDRARHGNVPLIPWFLDQMRQYEQKNGRRILDVLDIHYYPQAVGVYNGTSDPTTNALRLRSTRSLWNKSYVDESWINTPVNLIPRMREWINQYYPGTKLGITEWNWGADTTMSGALAISQVLGIFGREGVYLASYWRFPPSESPGYYAFKLYTNFDGNGSTFGDISYPVKVADDQKVGAFAAMDSKSGRVRLMLINMQPEAAQKIEVRPGKVLPAQKIGVYQLRAASGSKVAVQPGLDFAGGNKVQLSLPAYSVTLLDLDPGK